MVENPELGALIATDMTRCIQCTRCVRFGTEIAGIRELGATGRGEHMKIGTYVAHTVESELSGNVIDLCPVGALTSKPFRFKARAWEMTQFPSVAPHDGVGSNLYLHAKGNRVLRTVPRENEGVNEIWLSDRDRFAYQGFNHQDRLQRPMLKRDGSWQECSWDEALEAAAKILREQGAETGGLMGPLQTLEEGYLLQRLLRDLGSEHIDHRLRQVDFSDDSVAPAMPWLGQSLQELEQLERVLIVGSNLRMEQPLINLRLRKATHEGARVFALNPVAYEFNLYHQENLLAAPAEMVGRLGAIAQAAAEISGQALPTELQGLVSGKADAQAQQLAQELHQCETGGLLLGAITQAHPQSAALRGLAHFIAQATQTQLGYLPSSGASASATVAGVLPHRTAGGQGVSTPGANAAQQLQSPRPGYLLMGVEPEVDCWSGSAALETLSQAQGVVALSAYRSAGLEQVADVLLPIALYPETSGTYINAAGEWQSFAGAVAPAGEARPAWKVLRVLGNLCDLNGYNYLSSEEVLDEVKRVAATLQPSNEQGYVTLSAASADGLMRLGEVPAYAVDGVVRRAAALQASLHAGQAAVRIHPDQAQSLGIAEAGEVLAKQGEREVHLALELDERVAPGCALIAAGLNATAPLGDAVAEIQLEKA